MIASAKPPLVLKKRVLSTRQLNQPKNVFGSWGEDHATTFLISHSYTILDCNVAFGGYELDIVALDQKCNEVVFVEVKTRQSAVYGHPSAAVGYKKQLALRKAAFQYLQARQLEKAFRFDIITVLPDRIEHFENISW